MLEEVKRKPKVQFKQGRAKKQAPYAPFTTTFIFFGYAPVLAPANSLKYILKALCRRLVFELVEMEQIKKKLYNFPFLAMTSQTKEKKHRDKHTVHCNNNNLILYQAKKHHSHLK